MVTNPFDLTGRVALVTGGGSGLGFAIARGLASAGARVAINGRNFDKLEIAKTALAEERIDAHAYAFDVADEESVAAGIGALVRDLGPIDVLVNNAAINRRQPIDQLSLADWRALQATNVDGPFLLLRAVLPSMKAQRRGKVINICSLASDLGRPGIAAYATNKGALKMLTRTLAVELAPHNIQVNGIAPGFFKTAMNAPLVADKEFSAWVERRTPAGRWGDPPEVAGAAVFLASAAADYVTGHILYVDGGFSASY